MKAIYKQYTDFQLADRLAYVDAYAFTEIYDRYWPLLYRHACKMLDDEDEAIDVVQEVFLTLWAKSHELQVMDSLSSYLYAATRNRVIDTINRGKRRASYLSSLQKYLDKGEFMTDKVLLEKELQHKIEQEVSFLPRKMRRVFELSRNEHLSYKEIAEKENISEGTVKKQISNAIKLLKPKFDTFLLGLVAISSVFYAILL